MKSVMNHNFSNIPAPEVQRSTFDRSSGLKTAFNAGDLVPIFVDEILPGDTVKMLASFMARLSTFIYPIMDNLFFETFFFFVPCRLLWDNWEHFNGSQTNPDDDTDFLIPTLGDPVIAQDTIFDFFGLPVRDLADGEPINALPFRAYNMIYNEWFRDQNLQDSQLFATDDGPDDPAWYTLMKRGKRHDYFTSCLPWPQKGDSVMLPLGTTAPVIGDGNALGLLGNSAGVNLYNGDNAGYGTLSLYTPSGVHGVGTTPSGGSQVTTFEYVGLNTDPAKSHVYADLASATAATVNQIREAFQFQKILERDARGGTRYVEFLKAHFGVTSPDYRLQRPEYLGGSSSRVTVSAVQQTSESGTTAQGKLAAFNTMHQQCGFNKSFTEHGYIIGLANIRADITYQDGLRKLWSRQTRFDFYLPALAHLGEQAVLRKEIYYVDSTAEEVFGYQERWAEMRYFPSMVTGAMRSSYTGGSLDPWHLALDFNGTAPTLNNTFIRDQPPVDRVVAVTEAEAPNAILDCYFSMKHTRPLPTYSVPGQMDRF